MTKPIFILDTSMGSEPPSVTPLMSWGDPFLNLFQVLDYKPDNLPYAACLRTLMGADFDYQYIVSPIQWEASHNNVFVVNEGHRLLAKLKDIEPYFVALQDFVREQEGDLLAFNDWTWLLKLPNAPSIFAPPPALLCHQPLLPFIESLHETAFWRLFLTEIQMLFSSLNPLMGSFVNGVWVYGAGEPIYSQSTPLITNHASWLQSLKLLSSEVKYESNLLDRDKNKIYILKENNSDKLSQLISKHKQYELYANDLAYAYQKPSWFKRFLG